jgi:hypothetical protein
VFGFLGVTDVFDRRLDSLVVVLSLWYGAKIRSGDKVGYPRSGPVLRIWEIRNGTWIGRNDPSRD